MFLIGYSLDNSLKTIACSQITTYFVYTISYYTLHLISALYYLNPVSVGIYINMIWIGHLENSNVVSVPDNELHAI